jgi:hypothetical protein
METKNAVLKILWNIFVKSNLLSAKCLANSTEKLMKKDEKNL